MKRCTLVAIGLILLSGCGTDDPAQPVEPTTPAVSTTKAGPVEPTMPPAASEQSKAGAIAFAKYYWDVVNFALATLDTGKLRSLHDTSCDRCTTGVTWIDSVRRAGGRIIGGANHADVIDTIRLQKDASAWAVEVHVGADRARVTGAGKLNQSVAPGDAKDIFTLRFRSGEWRVASWRPV